MKILIVDDVEFTRLIVREALNILQKEQNFKITDIEEASGFREALKKLKTGVFDLIITDLRLKDGLGTELARIVRKRQSNTKIAALTMYPKEFETVKDLFDGFIKKPISPEELKTKLTELFKQEYQNG